MYLPVTLGPRDKIALKWKFATEASGVVHIGLWVGGAVAIK